jgi:ADP-ribosyl-[dinitrogen reductase] hydrolase
MFLTFCPGKKCVSATSFTVWDRDVTADVARMAAVYGVDGVVSMLEVDEEERTCKAHGLYDLYRQVFKEFWHIPTKDYSPPDLQASYNAIVDVVDALNSGMNVAVHCRGGLGRAGSFVAMVLISLGTDAFDAIKLVRQCRPGAIETKSQEQAIHIFANVLNHHIDA